MHTSGRGGISKMEEQMENETEPEMQACLPWDSRDAEPSTITNVISF